MPRSLASSIVLALLLAPACGGKVVVDAPPEPPAPTCEDFCQKMAACGTQDCASTCKVLDALTAADLCTTEIEGLFTCVDTAANPCSPTECNGTLTAAATCMSQACQSQPTLCSAP